MNMKDMTNEQWQEIVDDMSPMGQMVNELKLDLEVTLRLTSGETLRGFVTETPNPQILGLLEASEVMRMQAADPKEWDRLREEQGTPMHQVTRTLYIDVYSIEVLGVALKPVMLNVYGGKLL